MRVTEATTRTLMLAGVARSLRRKVLLVVLSTTAAALLVAGTALLVYEAGTYREGWIADLTTQADLLARTSAPALAFDDRDAANANLALLQGRPGILAAGLYTPEGELFASYRQDRDAALPESLPPPGHRIDANRIYMVREVTEGAERLGFVYLQGRYELRDRVLDYLGILALVLLLSLLVAAIFSGWLQSTLTGPVLAVAGAARKVVDERDFSQRVRRTTDDEIGVLVDAFNTMLAEVGQRSQALEESNRVLQRETEERRAAEAALRLADHRKDEFLATLAHELRNPLAAIAAAVRLLERRGADPKVSAMARDTLGRQVGLMVRLIDDLMDASRLTRGKLTLRTEPIALAEVVDAALETARPAIEARGHQLRVELPREPVILEADAQRLAQVLTNLLTNAAKYTDGSGEILLGAERQGAELVIRVQDTGIGIPADSLDSIFGMFSQVHSALDRTQGGLGIGLALARGLIELHGGTLTASSEGPGRGSTFTLRLPLKDAVARVEPEAPSEERAVARRRVLIADDNRDTAEGLAMLLSMEGHDVQTAHDGQAALELAQRSRPEILLLDIGMPKLNGYELAQRLRGEPWGAALKLVAITGWGQEADKHRAREAGFDHHLTKPVDPSTIQSLLRALE